MENRIIQLAETNGIEDVSTKLYEETGELITALAKLQLQSKNLTVGERLQLGADLLEEIADVEVVLAQMKYLLKAEKAVDILRETKIDRQLTRFGLK